MNLLDATTEFHKKADLPDAEFFKSQLSSDKLSKLRALRIRLLREEFYEYIDGEDNDNIVEMVDGLLDTIVIAWGTLLAYIGEHRALKAAAAVAESNLSKVDGSLGPIVRREDGKLLKPEGWQPPDIAKAIA